MAQRLVRAKHKIRDAGIPYIVPETNDIAARLDAVLTVIYLVFNEGYVATRGASLVRTDLCAEAIRLGRLVIALMEPQPPAEAKALLALMLLHDARREARLDEAEKSSFSKNRTAAAGTTSRSPRLASRQGRVARRAGPIRPAGGDRRRALQGCSSCRHGLGRNRPPLRSTGARTALAHRFLEPCRGSRHGGRPSRRPCNDR